MSAPQIFFVSLFLVSTIGFAQQNAIEVYSKDGRLTNTFISNLCNAARASKKPERNVLELEGLLNLAAKTTNADSLQSKKIYAWHKKYASQCLCESTKKYPRGDFIRQIVNSNNRDFANHIGPKNRLSLYLSFKDPVDSMNIMEYVNDVRIKLEASYDNKRFEFQQDKKWRNIMFFYFLFSEFSIN